MKLLFSAALAGAAMTGLLALAPTTASAMPVATAGVHQSAADVTEVRWHGQRRWHRGHHYGWRHHSWRPRHHYRRHRW
jgi:hypothetical protein